MPIESARHSVVISGVTAFVRLGYQRAAVVGAWRVEGNWFVGQVQEVDGFRITQSPLTLEIPNKDGPPTCRPLTDVTVYQGQLTARVLKRSGA